MLFNRIEPTCALLLTMVLGSTACSNDTTASETANTTTSNDSNTPDEESDTESETETETETDEPPDPTTQGITIPADHGDLPDCDPLFQDCPDGEKCVPYASGGASWDDVKCVPILGDGQPGESCTYAGPVEATDDCDGASLCWNTVDVDGALVGTCTPFCGPPFDDPQCPDQTACLMSNNDSIALCIQTCDPVAQDCPEGQGCYLHGGELLCVPDFSDPSDEPCDFLAQCPSGSECVAAELVPECAGTACCADYCSLSNPVCEQPGTECVPLFDDPPAGYEDVGLCVIPE